MNEVYIIKNEKIAALEKQFKQDVLREQWGEYLSKIKTQEDLKIFRKSIFRTNNDFKSVLGVRSEKGIIASLILLREKSLKLEKLMQDKKINNDKYENNFYCEDCGNHTFYSSKELEHVGFVQCEYCGQSSIR